MTGVPAQHELSVRQPVAKIDDRIPLVGSPMHPVGRVRHEVPLAAPGRVGTTPRVPVHGLVPLRRVIVPRVLDDAEVPPGTDQVVVGRSLILSNPQTRLLPVDAVLRRGVCDPSRRVVPRLEQTVFLVVVQRIADYAGHSSFPRLCPLQHRRVRFDRPLHHNLKSAEALDEEVIQEQLSFGTDMHWHELVAPIWLTSAVPHRASMVDDTFTIFHAQLSSVKGSRIWNG